MPQSDQQSIHLLLPKQELRSLKRQAKQQNKSVAELIRLAVRKAYGPTDPKRRQQAFQRLAQHDELEMEDWPAVKQSLLKRYE